MVNDGSAKCELSSLDVTAMEDIVRRADEIRLKRNRLVHDTGMMNEYLQSDADDMYKNIISIVERYVKSMVSTVVYQKNRKETSKDIEDSVEPTFPMFISTITPHTFEQSEFIEAFCKRLEQIGIKPIRYVFSDFDRRDPMGKVRRYIEKCHGVIVLGLERSHAYFYRDKEGSEKESESIQRRYSSAWLQLETGMAIGMGKDIFVLCQENLYGDGIFDRNWNSYAPVELKMPLNINDLVIMEILQVLVDYKKEHET